MADGIGHSPSVELVGVPERTDAEMVDVRVRARSNGGGVGRVQLFLNGARVRGAEGSRGLQVVADRENAPVHEEVFRVRLAPGTNELRAEAYSELGSVRGPVSRASIVSTREEAAP